MRRTNLKPRKIVNDNEVQSSKNGVQSKSNSEITNWGPIVLIPLSEIKDNPDQARSVINEKNLSRLKSSMEKEDLLKPVLLLKESTKKGYTLKDGHRRVRCAKELGWTHIESRVSVNTFRGELASISTNESSEPIHFMDKGREVLVYERHLKSLGKSSKIEDIANYFQASEATIYEWKRYAQIPDEVRALVVNEGIAGTTIPRKVEKIWKRVNKSEMPISGKIQEAIFLIEPIIEEFLLNKANKSELPEKRITETVIPSDRPRISNFIYYSRDTDEYIVRDSAINNLDTNEKMRLRKKAERLLSLLSTD